MITGSDVLGCLLSRMGGERKGRDHRCAKPLSNFLHRRGYSYKKGLIAQERDKPAARKARLDWVRWQKIMQDHPYRLIFIDETGTDTSMTRAYGRCPKGLRLKGAAPFRR